MLGLWISHAHAQTQASGNLRVTVGSGYDSNASRDYQEVGTDGDAMLLALVSLQGKLLGPRLSLAGKYDGGARKFFLLPSEDMLAQALSVDAGLYLADAWTLGATARLKDRRGSDRSYSDLWGGGYVLFTPDDKVQFKVTGAGHRFLYWPSFGYTYGATEVGLTASYNFTRQHQVLTFGEYGARQYMQQARCDPVAPVCPSSLLPRMDSSLAVGGGYAYRGKFSFGASYTFWELDSNSFGESQRRHRLDVSAGFRFPWQLMLFTQASLTLTRYLDGIFLSPDQALIEDDESTNSVAVRLVRPLGQVFDVEVRYALYQATFLNALTPGGLSYWRHVVWGGLTWRP